MGNRQTLRDFLEATQETNLPPQKITFYRKAGAVSRKDAALYTYL